ncbi:MAG: hypothetical protein QG635_1476 [Bacteroidota bacterium]|nr:hypothetical protein [Bacteroidota bacterium]
MKNKKFTKGILIYLFTIMLLLITQGCQKNPNEPDKNANIIYTNSFETIDEVQDWYGLDESSIVDDAAPNSGIKSVHLCGGCIQPAAMYRIGYVCENDGNYLIGCWAKKGEGNDNGSIKLTNGVYDQNSRETIIYFDSVSTWKYYEKSGSFRKGDSLTVEIMVGGFAVGCVYIDNIVVKKVE